MGLAYVKPPLETAVEFVGHGLVAALLLAAVLSAPSRRRPEHPLTLSGRPAAALARISYGMYLWHAPVAANLSLSRLAEAPGGGVVYVVGAVLASAACGAVSYFLVERHVLRSRWYAGRPRHAGWDVPPP
jgi:peptidoglycan/LPS O-acetylase OafA/YrhL